MLGCVMVSKGMLGSQGVLGCVRESECVRVC